GCSRMTIVDRLRRLLKPRHIAVAGGRLASIIIRESERIGYAGPIWPIHPAKTEVSGHRAYAGVDDLPDAPDAVFIGAPREPTIDIVGALSRRGAGAAVCYAAGFAEIGGEGVATQKRLLEPANGLPLVRTN